MHCTFFKDYGVCVGKAHQAARAARSLVEGSARWLMWEPWCPLLLGRRLRLMDTPMLFNNCLLHSQCLLLPARSGATERGSAAFTKDDWRHLATVAAGKGAPGESGESACAGERHSESARGAHNGGGRFGVKRSRRPPMRACLSRGSRGGPRGGAGGTAARPSEAPLWCGGVAGGVSDSLSLLSFAPALCASGNAAASLRFWLCR